MAPAISACACFFHCSICFFVSNLVTTLLSVVGALWNDDIDICYIYIYSVFSSRGHFLNDVLPQMAVRYSHTIKHVIVAVWKSVLSNLNISEIPEKS